MTAREYIREQIDAAMAVEDPAVVLQAAAALLNCTVYEVPARAEVLIMEMERREDVEKTGGPP